MIILLLKPRKTLSNDFQDILKQDENEFILDIESIINLEEKTNYFNDNLNKEYPNICIIGLNYYEKWRICFF